MTVALYPACELELVTPSGGRVAVEQREVIARPFYRLVHFARPDPPPGPPVMVVGALSGHTSLLFHDLLAGLAACRDLYLIDWHDARDVPVSDGDFGMDDNIAAILDCIERLEGETHLVGVCQSAMPALAAAAVRAAAGLPEPRSVTLFGGIIDARINPTRIGQFAAERPLSWFEGHAIDTVPALFKGSGRQVHPAYLQRVGLQAYMARHFATGGELLYKMMNDDGADAVRHPFPALFFTLMDLPAALYLDGIRLVFQDFALPRGRLTWRGIAVEPAALTKCALITIEGERDDISGLGQTRAAHELCATIPAHRRLHHLQPGIGHFGLFHGRAWRHEILPRLNGFLRDLDQSLR